MQRMLSSTFWREETTMSDMFCFQCEQTAGGKGSLPVFAYDV